jgi:hypothetical protein
MLRSVKKQLAMAGELGSLSTEGVTNYPDEQSAALGLLGEVTSLLVNQIVDFVVIGGWLPFLFNSRPIPHPGTFDVDILLNEATSRSSFEQDAQLLLRSGYLRAPKNQFQLHRILCVRGERLVYHVDFLHRRYADDTDDLIRNWGRVQSIAGPGTDIIFTAAERMLRSVDVVLPDGKNRCVTASFCTEVGFLSAKGRSAQVPKRTRDAFDVFLVIRQSQDYDRLVARSKELMTDPVFKLSLINLRDGFRDGRLLPQAAAHLREQAPGLADPEETVRTAIDKFFSDVSFDLV